MGHLAYMQTLHYTFYMYLSSSGKCFNTLILLIVHLWQWQKKMAKLCIALLKTF